MTHSLSGERGAGAAPANASPAPPALPCGCNEDPIEGLKRIFVDYMQERGLARGDNPASRPVFRRLHGVAHARFEVLPGLRKDLRVGLFAKQATFQAWVRFSNDTQPNAPTRGGTVGIGIKLFGVEGKKASGTESCASTHDFILQNHDVFFVDNAKEMCVFSCMSVNGKGAEYEKQHPITKQILDEMEKDVSTVLGTSYWSVLPYAFGASDKCRYVKYKLEPVEPLPPGPGGKPDLDDPGYLRADLRERLKHGEARFRFMVQLQTNGRNMPLDKATTRWSEKTSRPVHVATLVIPMQDVDTRGQAAYGENLAMNPWHALQEHRPVGSIAEARRAVYEASSERRRNVNGVPVAEPEEPRPPGARYPQAKGPIVRAKIHPAIGVARVGNSKEEYFYGPEITAPQPRPAGFYRDQQGALKRQAARFRIYGYNAAGEVVQELTTSTANIRWTVHVANRKAAWYCWDIALDIPEAATTALPRRNKGVTGADRSGLVIDPGPRSIEGPSQGGADHRLEGAFSCGGKKTKVYLGELRTDGAGRLVFLGGRGASASPTGQPILPDGDMGFINADGWYDDMSDGPVTAEVSIEGRDIEVEPAWVVTAPPNYAPDVLGIRTLYDLLFDLYVRNGLLPFPEQVSFRDDILPLLRRFARMGWVNKAFEAVFGRGAPFDFEDPALVSRLAEKPGPIDTWGELRRRVLNSFRDPQATNGDPAPWPWIYGDAMNTVANVDSPRQNASISITQFNMLERWAKGEFKADWDPAVDAPRAAAAKSATADSDPLEGVPVEEQPHLLDRAALDYCLADAFHPGCEVTWPVRHASLFTSPFRIRRRSGEEPDYGKILTPSIALSFDGPLYGQGPGTLTRWMGLPWQADTAYCRAGYDPNYDPVAPTFWPARVPNQVLTANDYAIVMDAARPREERLAAFSNRAEWVRGLSGTTSDQMNQMVKEFGRMGLLETKPGVEGDEILPPVMFVESIPAEAGPLGKKKGGDEKDKGEKPRLTPHRVGWGTPHEVSEAALLVRQGRRQ